MNRRSCTRERFLRSFFRGRAQRSEAGDTLIEILLTLIVLSLASVAVITAFTTTIGASGEHRSLATFNTVLRSATETAISQIQGNGAVTFNPCATTAYYQTGPGAVNFANVAPAGSNYSAQITGVSYWNGTVFSPSGCVAANNAPQQITITVTDNNNQTTYSNSFVVDNSVAVPLLPLCVEPDCLATHLVFATSPAGATVNTPFSTQPVVWAVTAYNTIARHDATTGLVLNITAGSGASGATLSGCQGIETSGVTSFSGCAINLGSSNTYTLTASDGSLTAGVSSSFYNYTQLTAPVITTAVPDATTPGGLDVNFNASSPSAGVASYTAEICTDPGMSLGCVTKTSYTSGSKIQGVIGTGYYSQIIAVGNPGYLGSTSAVFGPTITNYGPMGTPGTPTLNFGSVAGSVQVTFTASSPAVGGQTYSAEACTNAAMTANCVNQGVIASGGNLTGLNYTPGSSGGPGTVYYVTVTANAVTGYTASPPSAHSASSQAATSQVNNPTNVNTNASGGRNTLTVTFTRSTGAVPASYTDTLCTDPGMVQGCATITNAASTGSTFSGLNNRTTYYATVTAISPSNAYVSNTTNPTNGQGG